MTHLLCHACRAVFRGHKKEQSRGHGELSLVLHHNSFNAFHGGFSTGCVICTRLIRHLDSELGGPRPLESFRTELILHDYGSPGKIDFAMKWETKGQSQCLKFEFSILPIDPAIDFQQLCQSVSTSPTSTHTVQIMQTWLRDCLACHGRCCQRGHDAGEFRFPTRLLDVGEKESKECRLIWTASPSFPGGRYLTLSHRWGQSTFLQLKSDTIGTLTAGIPIAELPATFRDTTTIAHRLGIQYLWIDSLCIQQDSTEDWVRESPTMQHVYGFATVNIVAGYSTGPEDGLFHPRDTLLFKPIIISSEWDDKPNAGYLLWDSSDFQSDFEFAPLTQRGWVFQERLLAPRILQFGKKQVYWRCSELFACETWPRGVLSRAGEALRCGTDLDQLDGNATMETPWLNVTFEDLEELEHRPVDEFPKGPVTDWERLVSEYSRGELTFPGDKLVALSGVAKLFQQTFGDRYLAGIWWKALARLLSWRRDDDKDQEQGVRPGFLAWRDDADKCQKPRARPAYRAPSWSWASVDGPITFPLANMDDLLWMAPLVEPVSACIMPLGVDDMAQLRGGHITVRARLHTLKIISQRDQWVEFEVDGVEVVMDVEGVLVLDAELDYKLDSVPQWFMPTMFLVKHMVSPLNNVEGLVLRKRNDSDTYERVGYLESPAGAADYGGAYFGLLIRPTREGILDVCRETNIEQIVTIV